ncbi:hypothetical protein LB519_06710 [Mesorhizobium sp. AD1-1]|uniref:hypothetical protein n=1 Tax=Mesorhizobium sp. AD1-1 TaxID=2876621 RepID=UPI001CCFF03D|nr:hypothetical protein [Mesorhizobium sp. AD1-1]MBZ9717536.1 hypothetical protein [Mesorhizobium sp. AD1-1]
MLAQILLIQGAATSKASFVDLHPAGIRRLELGGLNAVVIGFLNRNSVKHARFMVRCIKRINPAIRVGVVFWGGNGEDHGETAGKTGNDINADFIALDMVAAVTGALSRDPAVALKAIAKRRARRRPPARKKDALVPAR